MEFVGWLPVFARFGECGTHPLFTQTMAKGAQSDAPRRVDGRLWSLLRPLGTLLHHCVHYGPRRCLATLLEAGRLTWRLLRQGHRWHDVARFVHSRHYESQVLRPRGVPLFLPSVPFTYGQSPWVVEIEDSTTLFYPFLRNGETTQSPLHPPGPAFSGRARLLPSRKPEAQAEGREGEAPAAPGSPRREPRDAFASAAPRVSLGSRLGLPSARASTVPSECIKQSPYFAMVRDLLESPHCRAILTHVRSTAQSLPTLFASATIARKVHHVPLGIELPQRSVRHTTSGAINLLFTNSWHQDPRNFYLRGGLDVLEVFAILKVRYPQLRLILRTSIPDLPPRYLRLLLEDRVQVLGNFLGREQMATLREESHVYLLPAARLHVVSLLQAMAAGQAVVVSDGWGFDEHVDHDRNGLVVRGRLGKTSWLDADSGVLCEDYRPTFEPDPTIVHGLVEAISRLVEDPPLRHRLGTQARADVAARHDVTHANGRLQAVLQQVMHAR